MTLAHDQLKQAVDALASQVMDPELQGLAGEVMRAAGYPTTLWQRVRALEQRLQACESRLRVLEQGPSEPPTLPARIVAWLRRLRRTAPVPAMGSLPSREGRSTRD